MFNNRYTEQAIVSTEEPPLLHRGEEPKMGRWESIKHYAARFTSPYWMAVHWRLLTIFCCFLATVFALPSISKDIQNSVDQANYSAASV